MNPYRKEFPILSRKVSGKILSYLDNAATTQKPRSVVRSEVDFYTHYNANVHRGLHFLSQEATDACDAVRDKVQKFIGAKSENEIIFTYGTTHGINLVAHSWGERAVKRGDEIILSIMEHHANIVPWQELAKRSGVKIKWVPLTQKSELDYRALAQSLSKKTKLVSLLHVSNVLGTVNDLERISEIVRSKSDAAILIDAAQSIAHIPINVRKLDMDFLVFSGHKMYGPTGVGVLYGKKSLLNDMPPFLTGGDMIIEVTKNTASFQDPPRRFEAGTPHIAGIIGLGAAVEFLTKHGLKKLASVETELTGYAYEKLRRIPGLTLYGPRERHGLVSFNIKGIHAHDIAEIANRFGVAIRSGNHCAMPLHRSLRIIASARASFACYNTTGEIDALIKALQEAKKIFS